MVKISCITPSVRPNGLDIVKRCLDRQFFHDYEWVVVSPFKYSECDKWIKEPIKKEGNHYNLNCAWNAAVKEADGELMVSIVDLIWFAPDTLEKFWFYYQKNPLTCISGIGDQYEGLENNKPAQLVWKNPLWKQGQFYEISPLDCELCLTSLPIKGIKDIGGFDEEFDKYAACSEKEMCLRLLKLGYSFFMDQSIEYRALKHPRLTSNWDERYFAGLPYFQQCINEINNGKRLKLDYILKEEYKKISEVSEKEPAV